MGLRLLGMAVILLLYAIVLLLHKLVTPLCPELVLSVGKMIPVVLDLRVDLRPIGS